MLQYYNRNLGLHRLKKTVKNVGRIKRNKNSNQKNTHKKHQTIGFPRKYRDI